jgi:NAD-dependent deacetylase
MNKTEIFLRMISESKKIVFLGGAGVSTGSGIPDYRSKDGIYTLGTPEEMLSHDKLFKETAEFYEFLKANMLYPDAKPNDVHYALAELEEMGKLTCIATQNVDGLHQAAGSKEVCEVHGNIKDYFCTDCGKSQNMRWIIEEGYACPDCGCMLRPDVVLYDEHIKSHEYSRATYLLEQADMLIIGGTSMQVYPFANLVEYFHGKYLVVVNKEKIEVSSNLWIDNDITETFGEVRKWIKNNKFQILSDS